MKKFNHTLNSIFSLESTKECLDNGVKRFSAKDLIYLEVEKLKPNKNQPRKIFDEQSMEELKASIVAQGILQPILARYNQAQDYYEIIAGERRLLAAKSASLTHVPVLLANLSDEESSVFSIIENIQRKDLSLIEEAEAYNKLIHEFKLTHEEISKKVGKSRSTITNLLRILSLPESVKEGLLGNKIHFGHAKIILSINSNYDREIFYKFILKNNLSVRDCEKHVENFKSNERQFISGFIKKDKKISDNKNKENIMDDLILKIMSILGYSVAVSMNDKEEIIIKIKDPAELMKKLNSLLNREIHEGIEV